MIDYDRRALVEAYIAVQPETRQEPYGSNTAFATAMLAHRKRVLDGLQRLFGVVLEREATPQNQRALFFMFNRVIASYLKVSAPGDGMVDATAIYQQLEQNGLERTALISGLTRIRECNEQVREHHLEVLDVLVGVFLGDRADATFTSADLAALGVDDSAGPKTADYDMWEDY
ncbi:MULTISPECIES: hypothetical protein [Actinosynnema]|uniref:hypothetical protein n=1 Tax=Actinosynnema TaxID=40566 RepID=UPI0020A2D6C7|nr:hypothetical protein [Actinosynnema pretiosum]MCP2098909.1 hypothetical protein [Actinosynnema pretiosum]